MFVPISKANEASAATKSLDVKAMAYDTYEIKFGQLLADWMDESKDFTFHGKVIPADRKQMTEGVFAFNRQIQEWQDAYTAVFNIFNLKLQDVQQTKNWF